MIKSDLILVRGCGICCRHKLQPLSQDGGVGGVGDSAMLGGGWPEGKG